ncbi:RNA-directed DNA polymerase from mobile element jockey-like protein [Pitangus sulphuratus]|nr:RNA-directed DNA polymerase from mobile element jockey-like protein [Pitangus sulphuratus]
MDDQTRQKEKYTRRIFKITQIFLMYACCEEICRVAVSRETAKKGKSRLANLVACYGRNTALADEGRETDIIYLKFCKAFGTVLHNVSKLERHGFDRWSTRWIRNQLDDCTQRAGVNCSMSKWRPMRSGVPHGSVLAPTLFNFSVGDMGSGIESTLSRFEGNMKLWNAVNTLEGRDDIQRDPDRVERWGCANLTKFNNAKCKFRYLSWGNPKHK